MVIGNGLVAKRFESYKRENDFLVFASGVSNSKTKNPELYEREMKLLENHVQQYNTRSLVYFSTCSVYDPQEKDSAYVKHKLQIEAFIQNQVKQFHIFRISNLAGKSANPNTLLNFFFNHVKSGVNFDVWTNACRNLIDIDDAYLIMDHILKNNLFPNGIVNIASPENIPVKRIIEAIESFMGIKSNYIEIEKGTCFDIDTSSIQPVIQNLAIRFGPEYISDMLNKYYQIAE
jgi:nucleoside-diphosphate-sugar epimerase